MSSTSAGRPPTRRLNSEDLPTFGRPTSATIGRRDSSSGVTSLARARRPTLLALLVAEAGQAFGRLRPLLGHLHVQPQVRGAADELRDLCARRGADVLDHDAG